MSAIISVVAAKRLTSIPRPSILQGYSSSVDVDIEGCWLAGRSVDMAEVCWSVVLNRPRGALHHHGIAEKHCAASQCGA